MDSSILAWRRIMGSDGYRVTMTGSDLRRALKELKPAFPKKKRAAMTQAVFIVSFDQVRISVPGAEVVKQA